MAINPVLKKKYEEGYQKGFERGTKLGFEQGKYSACMYFAERFDGLDKVPGIGPKSMKKIVEHFGSEYFQQVGK